MPLDVVYKSNTPTVEINNYFVVTPWPTDGNTYMSTNSNNYGDYMTTTQTYIEMLSYMRPEGAKAQRKFCNRFLRPILAILTTVAITSYV